MCFWISFLFHLIFFVVVRLFNSSSFFHSFRSQFSLTIWMRFYVQFIFCDPEKKNLYLITSRMLNGTLYHIIKIYWLWELRINPFRINIDFIINIFYSKLTRLSTHKRTMDRDKIKNNLHTRNLENTLNGLNIRMCRKGTISSCSQFFISSNPVCIHCHSNSIKWYLLNMRKQFHFNIKRKKAKI